jgi:hypothetical protein
MKELSEIAFRIKDETGIATSIKKNHVNIDSLFT